MLSNLFLQLTHIELLISYPVKEIASLAKRDSRFNVKLLNDIYFEDSFVDEGIHRLMMNHVVNWLYERGENPDAFVQRIIDRCAAFEAVPARSPAQPQWKTCPPGGAWKRSFNISSAI